MIGELISHYRITRQIGAGGMGVVYLARDEQLERDVAIKEARRRFRYKAQLLAKLNYRFSGRPATETTLSSNIIPGNTVRDLLAGGPLA
jgi:serine/threonine protein kinase